MSEIFTTYDKADSGSDLTVTASRVDWTTLLRNVEMHLTKSKGVGAIKDTAELSFIYNGSLLSSGMIVMVGGFANRQDDLLGLINNNDKNLTIFDNPPAINTNRPILRYYKDSGTFWQDFTGTLTRGVDRLFRLLPRSGNTYTLIIYKQDTVGLIEDTLTITPVDTIPDFEYNYACASYNSGGVQQATGYIKDMILTLVADGFTRSSQVKPLGIKGTMSIRNSKQIPNLGIKGGFR